MAFFGLNQVSALFRGLAVIVVAIVANATYSFGKGSIKDYRELLIAMLAAMLFWLGLSPFFVIIGAAVAGILLFKADKSVLSFIPDHKKTDTLFYKHVSLLFFYWLACL
ncbi:MAG: chromate transporter [bacterium]